VRRLFLLPLTLVLLVSCQERDPWAQDSSIPSEISFNQHIRPLLSSQCIQCHGPNIADGNLRLDLPSGVSTVVTDNSPKKSILWEKILTGHPTPLTSRDQALIWRWIKQGTPSEGHWASLPIKETSSDSLPAPLSLDDPITEAEFAFLARTLIGREPLAEETSLLAKSQPTRGQVLDGLMASESFARSLRTSLLLISGTKPLPKGTPFAPYLRWLENEIMDPQFSLRDFYVNALAGDLPPGAGQQGKIATAWVRLPNRTGFDSLAQRIAYCFLGLDLEQAPITNGLWPNAAEVLPEFLPHYPAAANGKIAIPPFLAVQTPPQAEALSKALKRESELWEAAHTPPESATAFFQQWMNEASPSVTIPDLATALSFDQNPPIDTAPTASGRLLSSVNHPIAGVQGRAISSPADFSGIPLNSVQAFTLSFFLKVPALPTEPAPILLATTEEGAPVGFRLSLSKQALSLQLLNGSKANSLAVSSQTLPTPGHWHHLVISYSGSRSAAGFKLWIDTKPTPLEITNSDLYGIAQAPQGKLLFRFPDNEAHQPAALDELQVHLAELSELEIAHLRDGKALLAAVRAEYPREDLLFNYYIRSKFEPQRAARQAAIAASGQVGAYQNQASLVPIAAAIPPNKVRPTLPFIPLPHNANPDRLGLAQWLFDEQNPLTPRVMASHLYQMVHGVSLLPVDSLLDFLAQKLISTNWDLRTALRTICLYPPSLISA